MDFKFLIIGDSTGRRINSFLSCLTEKERKEAVVIDWVNLIDKEEIFEKSILKNTIIRIEPPEKNTEIYKKFLKAGNKEQDLKSDISNIDMSDFKIIKPSIWFKGFKKVVLRLKQISEFKNIAGINNIFMNDIDDILIMMDKSSTHKYLEDKILNEGETSFILPKKLETSNSYEEFHFKNKGFLKCFIKLRYGSGSVGVLAYSRNNKSGEEVIRTSLEYEKIKGRNVFFGSYNLKEYRIKEDIENIVDWVLKEGAHIEKWIPKPKHNNLNYDIRSVVVGGISEYELARMSKTPITNLHLKNDREEFDAFATKEEVNIIKKASEAVMAHFEKSIYSGMDLILNKNKAPCIIDVNPFGDLLHNLLNTNRNPYYKEIEKAKKKFRSDCFGKYE